MSWGLDLLPLAEAIRCLGYIHVISQDWCHRVRNFRFYKYIDLACSIQLLVKISALRGYSVRIQGVKYLEGLENVGIDWIVVF